MQATHYRLITRYPKIDFTAAVVADLHDHRYDRILRILDRERPDIILIPGDLTENLEEAPGTYPRPGLSLLPLAAKLAPTFYSFGNHEVGAGHINLHKPAYQNPDRVAVHPAYRRVIAESGAVLLDDTYTVFRAMGIGGLGTGLLRPGRVPEHAWVSDLTHVKGFKLLLCHQPEYYDRYLRPYDLDLIVSGHAHGGQWRIFGRGVYAPDQPLFPKYTAGVHENRLVISRGVANTVAPIPRFFNPCEVVFIHVISQEG